MQIFVRKGSVMLFLLFSDLFLEELEFMDLFLDKEISKNPSRVINKRDLKR